MVSFTSSLYEQLTIDLQEIALQSENTLQKAERSYKATQAAIKELKAFILDYQFMDNDEEILFFKEIKPKFLRERIFYEELFYFEAGKPVGNSEILIAYHNQGLERIRLFFERNQRLYNYYRLGKDDYDKQFFLRNREQQDAYEEFDGRFCTPQSYKLGKVRAFEQLKQYLLSALEEPEDNNRSILPEADYGQKLVWTDSKVDFTEWVYGAYYAGSINNGNITVKQLFIEFQKFLNINAGNYYGTLQQNIRIRKRKGRTAYLNRQVESFEKNMDDADDNPRYQ